MTRGPVRKLNLAAIGQVAWIPFLTATLGTLAGGWFSGALLRRTGSLSIKTAATPDAMLQAISVGW